MRTFQHWRPHICPFDILIEATPQNSRVLDIGCGAGLFLGLLAHSNRIREGLGWDSSATAIALAISMRMRLAGNAELSFQSGDITESWPEGSFDVVSMIDVLHHVPPGNQETVIRQAAQCVNQGGILLFKDMVRRPRWRMWANQLHDIVLARQWVHPVDFVLLRSWLSDLGFVQTRYERKDMLWYGHEFAVFERRGK